MFLTLLRSLLHSLHSQDLLKYIPLYWKCRLASYAVLDGIAAVETGAMDKPVEDVVIETIEIED